MVLVDLPEQDPIGLLVAVVAVEVALEQVEVLAEEQVVVAGDLLDRGADRFDPCPGDRLSPGKISLYQTSELAQNLRSQPGSSYHDGFDESTSDSILRNDL